MILHIPLAHTGRNEVAPLTGARAARVGLCLGLMLAAFLLFLPSGLLVGDVQPWSYQQSVTLPHGTQKQATLYVPFFESPAPPGHPICAERGRRFLSMTISGALMKRPENTGHVQVRLYNWCTSSWDTFALSHDTFTIGVPKAYTSSDGRVLLQLANQNSSSEVLAHV